MAYREVSPERWPESEFEVIERQLAAAAVEATTARSDGSELAKRFLQLTANWLDMTVASLVLVVGDTYLGPLLSSSDTRRGLTFSAGEGPVLDAARTGVTVKVPDMAEARTRWPIYAQTALANGLRSTICIPLWGRHTLKLLLVIGSPLPLNLASVPSEGLQRLARLADKCLCANPAVVTTQSLKQHVDGAVRRNAVVYQACGALSAKLFISPSEALDLLRLRAWADGRTLPDIAHQTLSHPDH